MMTLRPEGKNALLGTRLFLVSARAAEGSVEAMQVKRLTKTFRLHDIGVDRRTVGERIDAPPNAISVDVDEEIQSEFQCDLTAESDHLPEFPGRIDVQHGKGRLGRIKGLHRKMQHDGRVFADGIKHHRLLTLGNHFTHDEDAFGFKPLEVGQPMSNIEQFITPVSTAQHIAMRLAF